MAPASRAADSSGSADLSSAAATASLSSAAKSSSSAEPTPRERHPQRIALVTGAAGGIGASCAVKLAEDGFDIVIVDMKPAADTARQVQATGRNCEVICADITTPEAVESLHSRVAATFGRCDVLLNNAGVYSMTSLETLDFAGWRRFMALNLDAPFLLSKAFAPLMRAQRQGRIISIASNSFHANVPGLTAYIASKGGLIGLMRGLASELGPEGITANVVAPGPILTDQLRSMLTDPEGQPSETTLTQFFAQITATQAIKRRGMPGDVASVVAFLASAAAAFITGQTIVVDGGCVRL
jgi:NAD(P)-dependent dehydrogenase (short-subunit alcohol dehydrogenase family)